MRASLPPVSSLLQVGSLLPLRDRLLAGLAVLRRGTRSPPPPLPGVGSRLRVHTTGRGVSPSRAPFS